MYTAKMHHNSLLGRPINFIVGADMWTCAPTSGAQTGCHGNDGCSATGPRNLQFIVVYFKNAMVYKVQNMHISS